MNAPFGARMGLVPWIKKFIEHGNGICLAWISTGRNTANIALKSLLAKGFI
jgi:hypothetical protein